MRYNAILRTIYEIQNELPLEQAIEIFQKEMGIWDRTSIKAYFGTQETVSKRKMTRISRYPRTGTMSFKTIELEQPVKKKKGYLEKLGLVSYEKRGNIWFLILNNEGLVPEFWRKSNREREREIENDIDKISLNPILQGKECEKTALEVVSPIKKIEKRESYRVREKFDNTVIVPPNLTDKESRILRVATEEGS